MIDLGEKLKKSAMVLFTVIWLLLASVVLAFDPLFEARIDYDAGSNPWTVFACDIDGDGDNDLAVANYDSNSVSILRNNGDGTYQNRLTFPRFERRIGHLLSVEILRKSIK